MKNVLFIIPPESKIKDVKQGGAQFLRTGIAYIASYLRQNSIHVKIFDCRALHQDIDQILKTIEEFHPNFVGLGPYTEEIYEANRICKIIKEKYPGIVTILGGPHVSALPQRTLEEFPAVDLVVHGEGERTVLDIVNGKNIEDIKGLAYRHEGKIVINDPPEVIQDIDSLPYPAWDLFPLDTYRGISTIHLSEKIIDPILEMPVLSSRGCPFKCNFCYKTFPGLRNRDPIKIADEIEFNVNTYGASEIFFVEGTFAAHRAQGEQLCDELIKRGLNKKIKWMAETRVTAVNENLLIKMKEAGCQQINFGVETGDEQILKNSKKGITLEQIINAVELAKKIGFKVSCFFIIGHPFETKKSIRKTYALARKIDPDLMNVGIMIPYPGTQIRDMAEKGEGDYNLVCDDWSEYTKQRGGPLELKTIPLRELRRIQSIEYLKYYLRPKKILFILKHLPIKKIIKIITSLLSAGFVRNSRSNPAQ